MRNPTTPEPALRQLQQAFADHIRNPRGVPVPTGVEPRRMAIYSELFFNNLASFLGDSFPVLRRILPDERWYDMVRDFYINHACGTPLFTRLGEEFLQYLQRERDPVDGDPPFLAELAHYEWVELALTLSDAEPLRNAGNPSGELHRCAVRLSPLAWPLRYRFPVQRIRDGYQPASPAAEPVHLLVYRDGEERVVFLEIDAWTYGLLSLLRSVGQARIDELLQSLAEVTQHPDADGLFAGGIGLCRMLLQRGVIGVASAAAADAPEARPTTGSRVPSGA